MRIAHFIPSFGLGGAELLTVRLCAEIKKQRPDYDLYIVSMYARQQTGVLREAVRAGAEIVELGKRSGFDLTMVGKIRRFLDYAKPDIVHTHLVCLAYAMLPVAFGYRGAAFHTFHTIAKKENVFPVRVLLRLFLKHSKWKCVALSGLIGATVNNAYGIIPYVVNNGVEIDRGIFNEEPQKVREEIGVPKDAFIIISVGRLAKEKNQELLIRAFKDVGKHEPKAWLVLVGGDANKKHYLRRLTQIIAKYPPTIKERIRFLGEREDVGRLLKIADLFALSSSWEGQPLALLEAMGYGLPIVATNVGGVQDVIEHGKTGILVPRENREKLVTAVRGLIENSEVGVEMGREAQMVFERTFHIRITAQRYLELYNAAMGL